MKNDSSKKYSSAGKHYLPEGVERLRILSAQLHAVVMVGANHDIHRWHPDIRDYYLWLVTDMSQEMRDGIQNMVSASSPRPFDERLKEEKRAA